jgi:hypothetical protein
MMLHQMLGFPVDVPVVNSRTGVLLLCQKKDLQESKFILCHAM